MSVVFDPVLGQLRTNDAAGSYLPLTGGALTGALSINNTAAGVDALLVTTTADPNVSPNPIAFKVLNTAADAVFSIETNASGHAAFGQLVTSSLSYVGLNAFQSGGGELWVIGRQGDNSGFNIYTNGAIKAATFDDSQNTLLYGNLSLKIAGATASLTGSSSGSTSLKASAVASGTLTLPATTATISTIPATNTTHYSCLGAQTGVGTETANVLYLGSIQIPESVTLNGVYIYNGPTQVGNVLVSLYDANGNLVASSNSTASSGSYGVQAIPFTSSYAAAAGVYFIGVMPSSSSDTFWLICAFSASASYSQGAFTLPSSVTPPMNGGNYIIHAGTY